MGKVLEIRVHGVSNTPPESMLRERGLDRPALRLVAGDEQTGFYRRWGDGQDAAFITEAYSWGQLTAGFSRAKKDLQRAGWAVLLPFALVNVALWAAPGGSVDFRSAGGKRRGLMSGTYIVRVLALGLTATMTAGAAGVGMDQVGWQCRDGCARTLPGTGFIGAGFWAEGLRSVAVGMLVPVAVLFLLWLLARRSFAYEAELPDPELPDPALPDPAQPGPGLPGPAVPDIPDGASPLEHPAFWSGDGQVRRLTALHLAAGLVTVAGLAVAAGIQVDSGLPPAQRPAEWLRWTGIACVAVLAVAAGITLFHPLRRDLRERASGGRPTTGYGSWPPFALGCAALGVVLAAIYLLVPSRSGATSLRDGALDGGLPGFAGAVNGLFVGQFLLVLLLAARGRSRRRLVGTAAVSAAAVAVAVYAYDWLKDKVGAPALFLSIAGIGTIVAVAAVGGRRQADERHSDPVWGGRSAAVIAGAGWAAGSLYAAAVLFWMADWLGGDATVTSGASAVVLPPALLWSALGLLAFLLPLGVVALATVLTLRRLRAAEFPAVIGERKVRAGESRQAHEERRAHDVARWIGVHRFVGERALGRVGALAIVVVGFAIVGVAGTFTGQSPVQLVTSWSWNGFVTSTVKWLTDTGSALAALLLLGLAALVGLAYRSPGPRRTMGIVWDIATFWPRGAHPFAPPCYGERAVPQLLTRICGTRDHPVLLAGHSQGAVIAVATIMQMPPERRRQVYLLTFGTQLTRLYGRVFPAFFGAAARQRVVDVLTDPDGRPPDSSGRDSTGPDSTGPRWASLHRPTDPLGWDIGSPERIDAAVVDPEGLAPTGGEVLDPPIRQHSDYPCSLEYAKARAVAVARLTGG